MVTGFHIVLRNHEPTPKHEKFNYIEAENLQKYTGNFLK